MSSHQRIITGIKELKQIMEEFEAKHSWPIDNKPDCINELDDLRQRLLGIENKLDDPQYAIQEMHGEIKEIERKIERLCSILKESPDQPRTNPYHSLNTSYVLTTGPVIRCDGVENLHVEILNNLDIPQTVRILLFDLGQMPKQSIDNRILTVNTDCLISEVFNIGPKELNILKFEVHVELLSGNKDGIFVFVAGARDNSLLLVPSNVFKHTELLSY